jgi:hypothetical protein
MDRGMASFHAWLEVLSWIKALVDATTLRADLQKAYEQHRQEKDTIAEARRVSQTFSTYSEEEVEALLKLLKACRDRFIAQGGGAERARCICSVLNEAMEGNGGKLPRIDDWERYYRELKCSRFETA